MVVVGSVPVAADFEVLFRMGFDVGFVTFFLCVVTSLRASLKMSLSESSSSVSVLGSLSLASSRFLTCDSGLPVSPGVVVSATVVVGVSAVNYPFVHFRLLSPVGACSSSPAVCRELMRSAELFPPPRQMPQSLRC